MTLYRLGEFAPELPAEDRCYVAPNATVIGRVRLGDEASIWFGAVVRGDNDVIEIGARSNVQDNCTLHVDPGFPLTIGEDCTLGHMAMVHGCTIGDGALIGMGATVLNGAKIGAGCLIGANALIPEGKEIPPNSLVMGQPGRVVRELTEEQVERLRKTANHYVERQKQYRAGLAPL